jgi:type 1 glutamine amidotransferase
MVRRMKRRASLTAIFAVCAWLALPAGLCRATGESPRIQVLIVDGFSNHDWRRTTHWVKAILEPTGLFEVSVSTAPARMDDPAYATWLPDFKGHEVVVQTCNDLTGTGCPWPEPAREAFDRYVREGGGVFMMHAANNAFASWEAYNRIIGLGWRKRDFGQALRVRDDGSIERIPAGEGPGTGHAIRQDRVVHRLGDHPIHHGMPRAWKTPLLEVLTYARGPAENVEVLSWGEDPAGHGRWPLEWTVRYGQGRVYASSFGHAWQDELAPVNFRCAGFQTLLVRAVQWLAKRPVDFPVPPDFPNEETLSLRPPVGEPGADP